MRIPSYFIAVALMALIAPAMAALCTPGQRADLAKLGYGEADIKEMCGNALALFERAYNAKESGDLRSAQQLFEQGLLIEPGNVLGQKFLAEVKDALASTQGNCKVFLMNETTMSIATPYKGGCKDGLANGQGSYTYSGKNAYGTWDGNVKGEFRDGKLNGNATIVQTQPLSRVDEGEYRENRAWNSIARFVGKDGVRIAIESRNGVHAFGTCRSDGQVQYEKNCTDRDRLLGTR